MISICIASLPERLSMLESTIESLRVQCDKFYVALNNYQSIPDFLKDDDVVIRDNKMGDAERYYCIDKIEGYIFTCDDDLIYPKNYVEYMIDGIKKYNSAVTLHGKTYDKPVFDEPLGIYRCLDDVDSDGRVNVGGTGVMAWHSDLLKVKYSDFKIRNMADLWFSKLCKEQGVRIMCLAHTKDNLIYQFPEHTIWHEEKGKGFVEQNKVLKMFIS